MHGEVSAKQRRPSDQSCAQRRDGISGWKRDPRNDRGAALRLRERGFRQPRRVWNTGSGRTDCNLERVQWPPASGDAAGGLRLGRGPGGGENEETERKP